MAGYEPESLKAEAGRLTLSPGEESLSQRINNAHKQLEAMSHEIGSLEEKLSPIIRPESTRINVGNTESEGDDVKNTSPLSNEVDMLNTRMSQLRRRLQNIFDRVEL